MKKFLRDLFNRPKSANNSASQSNSTLVSVSSASGAHDPVPGYDSGSAEPTTSSKYIGSILVLSTTTLPLPDDSATLNQGMCHPEFIPRIQRTYPTIQILSPLSSQQDHQAF